VGWNDGIVRLMGLENNKTAHHIDVSPSSGAQITHIGWAQSTIHSPSLKLSPNHSHIADEISREWNGKAEAPSSLSLPQELVFLDVMTALPKLSPLPSGSAGSG
jgi:anaphase-promoting complex subunit 4